MTEKFTPGPWSFDIEPGMGPDGDDYFYIGCNRGAMPDYPHCSSVVDPEHGITRVEDAHLIAAAPELYAALENALALLAAAETRIVDTAAIEKTVAGERLAIRPLSKAIANAMVTLSAALKKARGES